MELRELGFDQWFEERAAGPREAGCRFARVTSVDRGAFLVRTESGERRAELAGRLRLETPSAADAPCVGDWVGVRWPASDGPAVIQEILPRRTFLRRKQPGRVVDYQMIAANIDVAFIVQGCTFDFNVSRLERYLVAANDGRIESQLILSKTDLLPPGGLEGLMREIGNHGITAPVTPISNETGAGLEELRARLVPGRTYCLLGSSGVGKTTLINRLSDGAALETREVSASGEGVHTTSRRHLIVLAGGAMLIDTPGMRELGMLGSGGGVAETFADIAEYAARCRFPDCTHDREPGCAVRAALEDGTLGGDRYRDYLKLRKEAKFHDLSYAEKRRKDKNFGRMVNSANKRMKDRSGGRWDSPL